MLPGQMSSPRITSRMSAEGSGVEGPTGFGCPNYMQVSLRASSKLHGTPMTMQTRVSEASGCCEKQRLSNVTAKKYRALPAQWGSGHWACWARSLFEQACT